MASSPNFTVSPAVSSAVVPATANAAGYGTPTVGSNAIVVSAASVTVASVTTTSGSPLVTAASFAPTLPSVLPAIGCAVTGTGIPAGTTVAQILGGTMVLSQAATVTGTATLTFACNGIKLDEIDLFGVGSTIPGMLQIYLVDPATVFHPIYTVAVTTVAPSTTVAPFVATIPLDFFEVPSGWTLQVASFVASQPLNVIVYGGVF